MSAPGSQEGEPPSGLRALEARLPNPQKLRYWIPIAVAVVAGALRFTSLATHGLRLTFEKYPRAAQAMAQGTFSSERVLDFSPFYLELHRGLLAMGVDGALVARLLQCALGAVGCALIASIAMRLAGPLAALIAGLFAALSNDLVIYDQVLEPDSMLIFFSVLAMWAGLQTWPSAASPGCGRSLDPLRAAVLAGIASGITIALRPTAWLAIPALVLLFARPVRGPSRASAVAVGAFLIPLLVIWGGFELRNSSYGLQRAMSPWQVFYTGNNPMATGLWREDWLIKDIERYSKDAQPDHAHQLFRDVAVATGADPEAPDLYWRDLGFAFMREYPGAYLRLLFHKVLAAGQPHVPHDIGTVNRLQGRLNRGWPVLKSSVLMAPGLLGLLLCWRRTWPLSWAFFAQLGVCLAFFVSARYRLPLTPWACVGAAVLFQQLLARAMDEGLDARTRTLHFHLPLLATVGGVALFHLPLPPGQYARVEAVLGGRCNDLFLGAYRMRKEQRALEAARRLEGCLALSPWLVDYFPVLGVPLDPSASAARLLAERPEPEHADAWLLYRRAHWLELAGQRREAVSAFSRAAQSGGAGQPPLAYQSRVRAGINALRLGDRATAQEAFEKALRRMPGAGAALVGLALTDPQPAAARAWLRRAERVNPRLELLFFRGRMALESGQPERALGPLRELAEALPTYSHARLLLAHALFETGDLTEAARQIARAQVGLGNLRDHAFSPIPILRAFAAAHPAEESTWLLLGETADNLGEIEVALEAWRALGALRPLGAGEWTRQGDLLLAHDRPEAALESFQEALTLDSADTAARRGADLAKERVAAADRL